MTSLFDPCPTCDGQRCDQCDWTGTYVAWAEIKDRRHDPFVNADELGG
jgi:hypothetical protein